MCNKMTLQVNQQTGHSANLLISKYYVMYKKWVVQNSKDCS